MPRYTFLNREQPTASRHVAYLCGIKIKQNSRAPVRSHFHICYLLRERALLGLLLLFIRYKATSPHLCFEHVCISLGRAEFCTLWEPVSAVSQRRVNLLREIPSSISLCFLSARETHKAARNSEQCAATRKDMVLFSIRVVAFRPRRCRLQSETKS